MRGFRYRRLDIRSSHKLEILGLEKSVKGWKLQQASWNTMGCFGLRKGS